MSKRLFTIVDTFESGDYLVVVGDIPESEADYRNGDLLEVRRPDGSSVQVESTGIFYDPPAERSLSVGLKGIKKADAPIGSEVWLVNTGR